MQSPSVGRFLPVARNLRHGPHLSTLTGSAENSTAPTSALTPVPPRAAAAILGSMIFLILALMGVLVQTTWVDPVSATEAPTVESEHLAQR